MSLPIEQLTPEEIDRFIATAEELKLRRMHEDTFQAVISFAGREWAPGRYRRSRYFLVRIPKKWGQFSSKFDQVRDYLNSMDRFPLLYELSVSGHYEPFGVSRILHGDEGEVFEIT